MPSHMSVYAAYPHWNTIPDRSAHFRLGINAAGWWVLCEEGGHKGGLFRSREAALKYAREESLDGIFTIMHEPGVVELELPAMRRKR